MGQISVSPACAPPQALPCLFPSTMNHLTHSFNIFFIFQELYSLIQFHPPSPHALHMPAASITPVTSAPPGHDPCLSHQTPQPVHYLATSTCALVRPTNMSLMQLPLAKPHLEQSLQISLSGETYVSFLPGISVRDPRCDTQGPAARRDTQTPRDQQPG